MSECMNNSVHGIIRSVDWRTCACVEKGICARIEGLAHVFKEICACEDKIGGRMSYLV
jgi:hypothetical protein